MMKKNFFSLLLAVVGSLSLTCCGGGGGGGGSSAVVIQQMIPQGYNSCELDITNAFMGVEFQETRLEGSGNTGSFSIDSISMEDSETVSGEVGFHNISGTWHFNPNNSSRNKVYLSVDSHDGITQTPYQNYLLKTVEVFFESKVQVSDTVITGVTNQIRISYSRSDGSMGEKNIPFPAELRLTYSKK